MNNKTRDSKGQFGEITKYETEINTDNIFICIYSHTPVSGALFLHCKLLVQTIDNFYEAKLRERKMTQQTHLQAIYETGARITHDIKNLLQSLHAITSMATQSQHDADRTASQQLIERQLPQLTKRLQLALDKLQAPASTTQNNVDVSVWWRDLQSRTNLGDIEFASDISEDALVPAELFDRVAENLLENIRTKRQIEPDISVAVRLLCTPDNIVLTVCDSGSEIPQQLALSLFKDPIKSNTGLGIGLFQVAKQALSNGYDLSLTRNRNGRVCFELKNIVEENEPKLQSSR